MKTTTSVKMILLISVFLIFTNVHSLPAGDWDLPVMPAPLWASDEGFIEAMMSPLYENLPQEQQEPVDGGCASDDGDGEEAMDVADEESDGANGGDSGGDNGPSREQLQQSFTNQDVRVLVRYYYLLSQGSQTPTQIFEQLKFNLGDNCPSRRTIQNYYKDVVNGRLVACDRQRSGRPRTSVNDENVERVHNLMMESRRWTIEELSNELDISTGSVVSLMQKAGYREISSRWVPYQLTDRVRDLRVNLSTEYFSRWSSNRRYRDRIVAIDETWIRSYQPLNPNQAREWRRPGERPPTRVRENMSDRRIMAVVAFHGHKILAFEILKPGETMTGDRYYQFLNETLKPAVESNRIWNPIIMHDNARPHLVYSVRDFFERNNWERWVLPPYSPDMSPPDMDGFSRMKNKLRGQRFDSVDAMVGAVKAVIAEINWMEEFRGIDMLPGHWARIIMSKGDYVVK